MTTPTTSRTASGGRGRRHRPRLKTGLRTVWRSPATLQVGLDRRRGLLLDGLVEADRTALADLGADPPRRTRPTGPAGSGDRGDHSGRRRALGVLLDDAGALVSRPTDPRLIAALGPQRALLAPDAAAWALLDPAGGDGWDRLVARRSRTVQVVGVGRTAEALGETLAGTGVGAVGAPHPTPRPAADLVVLVEPDAADAVAARELLTQDVAHLSVVVREGGLVVGPLVVPGRTACLRCLDLHRSDRDPAWPMVLAQLLYQRTRQVAEAACPEETALSQLAASLACLQVLGHLDRLAGGDGAAAQPAPSAYSATLELALPDGLPERYLWPVHPDCGCCWPPPDAADAADQATMGR